MISLVKNHPFATINAVGFLILSLCCIFHQIADPAVWTMAMILFLYRWFVIIWCVISSIAAFISVKCRNGTAAAVTSVVGGFLGGFIAVNVFDADKETEQAVKVIFNIYIWLIIILVCGYFGIPVELMN
ncbi:MAG: hypothetical protein IJ007_09360 [Oscillospiraceae bacterium]|nr:hypothetical protein [Oscillospiraceae bacterium]